MTLKLSSKKSVILSILLHQYKTSFIPLVLHLSEGLEVLNELPPLPSWLRINLQFLYPARAASPSNLLYHLNFSLSLLSTIPPNLVCRASFAESLSAILIT